MVDQFTKRVGTVQRRGWCPIGSNPTIETSNSWDKVTVLGAVTDDSDSFYFWTEENLNRFHGIRLLEALTDRFGEDLVVFLDRAGYFVIHVAFPTGLSSQGVRSSPSHPLAFRSALTTQEPVYSRVCQFLRLPLMHLPATYLPPPQFPFWIRFVGDVHDQSRLHR